MIITDIIIKDFLSFDSVHLELPKSGLLLLTGWDEDLGRANGAGKSSLFQALTWCLYGEYPRNIKLEELIRRGQSACSVTIKFEVNGAKYVVTRKRPSGLEVVIGGEKQKGNPKYLQSLLDLAVGLSYGQFLIASYFPQNGNDSRFLKQNDATAKDFLATILNFNKTEAAYKKLHNELRELDLSLASKKAELQSIEESVKRFTSIGEMPLPDTPTREEVMAVKDEMTSLDLILANPPDTSAVDFDISKVQDAVSKVDAAYYNVEHLKTRIVNVRKGIEHLKSSEAHYMTCPECSAHLLESNGDLVVFDDQSSEAVKQQKIEAYEAEIAEFQQKINKLTPLVDKSKEFHSKLNGLIAKKHQVRHDYDMAAQKRSHLASKMEGFKKAAIAANQVKDQKRKVADQIAELRVSAATCAGNLLGLEREYILVAAAKGVLSPTGAIAYSLDSVMSDLNDEVGKYLDIFSHGTMTYRITSGEDKAKVTHHITKDGEDVSVGSLSGGEERGLILSVDLGLGEVIANRSGVSLPSVLMLDECFEGLDLVGKEKVLDALREVSKDRCIIVIDHSTEFSALFDKSIVVKKKDKVSRVEVT